MDDATDQLIEDLMGMVWYLRVNAPENTPLGKNDREQAESLYRRAEAFRKERRGDSTTVSDAVASRIGELFVDVSQGAMGVDRADPVGALIAHAKEWHTRWQAAIAQLSNAVAAFPPAVPPPSMLKAVYGPENRDLALGSLRPAGADAVNTEVAKVKAKLDAVADPPSCPNCDGWDYSGQGGPDGSVRTENCPECAPKLIEMLRAQLAEATRVIKQRNEMVEDFEEDYEEMNRKRKNLETRLSNEVGQHKITQEKRKEFEGYADRMCAERDKALADLAAVTRERDEAKKTAVFALEELKPTLIAQYNKNLEDLAAATADHLSFGFVQLPCSKELATNARATFNELHQRIAAAEERNRENVENARGRIIEANARAEKAEEERRLEIMKRPAYVESALWEVTGRLNTALAEVAALKEREAEAQIFVDNIKRANFRAKAEVSALRERTVVLPKFDNSTPVLVMDTICKCADAIRAVGVKVAES